MRSENEPILPLADGVIDLNDEIVAEVQAKKRLFPDVVIALAERQVSLNPDIDRLSAMRALRDELNMRIGKHVLNTGEMVE